jgi:Bacterial pre-peptidase C-terminal domain
MIGKRNKMRFMRPVVGIAFCLVGAIVSAEDAKPDKLPKILVAAPLAVTPGVPVKLALRGLFLDEMTDVKIVSPELKAEIASKGKSAVPQNYDAKRVGDTQAEIKFALPAETPAGMLRLVAVSAQGESEPFEIAVLKTGDLIEEKEPNDGFKSAQRITNGQTVAGTIHEARNVDIFQIEADAGQKLIVTVRATQAGSPLDPFLTVYDPAGQVVTGSDDVDCRDPRVEVTLTKAGSYFLSLQDANDAGGPHFAYLMTARLVSP